MPLVTRTTTQGNIFRQIAEPDDKTDGSLWVDISVDPPSISVANGTSYEPIQFGLNPGTTNIPLQVLI